MDTILSSLNALVEKLGGDTTDNKLIVDALNDISAKYGGDSDNKLIVDALNQIVDNYSGGGGTEFTLRDITIINNSGGAVTFLNNAAEDDGVVVAKSTLINVGKTVVVHCLAPTEASSGYTIQKGLILNNSTNNAEPTLTNDYISVDTHVIIGTARYTIFHINAKSPKDITITIS